MSSFFQFQFLDMSSERFTCNICSEVIEKAPHKICCGIKYCFPCSLKTWFKCHVCEKDDLNKHVQCDMCGKVGNFFTTSMCHEIHGNCEMWVCSECDKAKDDTATAFMFCSYKHYTEMLKEVFRHLE